MKHKILVAFALGLFFASGCNKAAFSPASLTIPNYSVVPENPGSLQSPPEIPANVQPPPAVPEKQCTSTEVEESIPTKVLFVLDQSGSNLTGRSIFQPGTDPDKSRREFALQSFLTNTERRKT